MVNRSIIIVNLYSHLLETNSTQINMTLLSIYNTQCGRKVRLYVDLLIIIMIIFIVYWFIMYHLFMIGISIKNE